jgi:hypothetical protein
VQQVLDEIESLPEMIQQEKVMNVADEQFHVSTSSKFLTSY